jgi:5-oxoprolinase (ATP-hydrolysing) subunit C
MSLIVVRATGLVTVQDLGRRGHMHQAVPPGGALVAELLIAANRAVANPEDAPAIEVLGRLVVRATTEVTVATERWGARLVHAADEITIASESARCTYLAVRGGVDVPRVLDGYGTLLCAGLGSPLRAGDLIHIGDRSAVATAVGSATSADALTSTAPIRVIPGPDGEAFGSDALAILTREPYRVLPTSDRVGTRLHGAVLPRTPGYREGSRPLVRGALEVPGDGQPIVLGPEHPTTGGYPVIAVIQTADLGRFFAIAPGGAVRFTA